MEINVLADPSHIHCDFEVDYCGWSNDTTAQFNWTRHQGKTSSTDTGPSTDHTQGRHCKFHVLTDMFP